MEVRDLHNKRKHHFHNIIPNSKAKAKTNISHFHDIIPNSKAKENLGISITFSPQELQ